MRIPFADVLLAGVVAISLVVVVVTDGPLDGPRELVALGFVAVFALLVLVRGCFPTVALAASVAALLAYYAVGLPPIGVALPVAAAFYSVAAAGRLRTAVLAAVALVALSSGFRLFAEGDSPLLVLGYELVTTVALLAAAIALGDTIRQRAELARQHAENIRRAADQHEQDMRRRADAERLRIARDLHDSLGHGITVITLTAADALDGPEGNLRGHVSQIRVASRRLLADLRTVVSALGPAGGASEGHGDLTALQTLAAESSVGGVEVTARVAPLAFEEPPMIQHALFRVAREAVTNALRHAAASSVTIMVDAGATRVGVEVVDDGRGIGDPVAGAGLDGMRHRMELLGGWCRVGPGPSGGTVVAAGFDRRSR